MKTFPGNTTSNDNLKSEFQKILKQEKKEQMMIKLIQFIKITLTFTLIQFLICIWSNKYNENMKKGTLFFCSLIFFLDFLFHSKILPYLAKVQFGNSKTPQNRVMVARIIKGFQFIFIICTLFNSTLFIFGYFQEPFLQGIGISIIIGIMQYFNLVIVRNLKFSFIIQMIYYIYFYLASSKELTQFDLLLLLTLAFTISIITSFQIAQRLKSFLEAFAAKIIDNTSIYLKFLEEKSESIMIKSLRDNTLFFSNKAFKQLDLNTQKFCI